MNENGPLESASTTVDVRGHLWPGIWRDLLPDDVAWMAPPRESRATCDACYLVALGELAADCQCCTYYPQIPNYMVGLALKDPRSRPAMVAQIEAGGALPRELINAPERFRRSVALYDREGFGQDREAMCPFFDPDTTHCRIYAYRNSVCSTFICAHDHGEAGQHYWDRLQQLIGHLEQAIAQWAMDRVGFSHDRHIDGLNALAGRIDLCSDPVTGLWTGEVLDQLWGDHRGQEIAFFERCADVVLQHREELYTLGSATRLRHALAYERAVRDWMPVGIRASVPAVADDEYAAEPIPSLYYKMQLAERELWRLPFGEGQVSLAAGVTLDDERLLLDEAGARALSLFEVPRVLDGDLLERLEVVGLERPREILAVWLRCGYLVVG